MGRLLLTCALQGKEQDGAGGLPSLPSLLRFVLFVSWSHLGQTRTQQTPAMIPRVLCHGHGKRKILQNNSAPVKVHPGPTHQIPPYLPSLCPTPKYRTTVRSEYTLFPHISLPNNSTMHRPHGPPIHTVVQRPRAEIVCT